MGAKPWSAAEVKYLIQNWGSVHPKQMSKKLGRSLRGIRHKAVEFKLGSIDRGYFSVGEIARETGYGPRRILSAMRALGITAERSYSVHERIHTGSKWKRTRLSFEAKEQILEFLAKHPDGKHILKNPKGVWGIAGKPPVCLGCGLTDKPHLARGFCKKCYDTKFRVRKSRAIASKPEVRTSANWTMQAS